VLPMNEDGKEIICVLIDSKLKDYLNKEAKTKGMTLSKLIREIIIDYIIESQTERETNDRQ
jgi:metal-responsive CopG/Arc/MetJ family transcriptional regulator